MQVTWFDEKCKESKQAYIVALKRFNLDKTQENRYDLYEKKKKLYKKCCKVAKNRYNRTIAEKMNELRGKKPRDFWQMFKKLKNVENGSEMGVQQFYMHFKALSSEISVENDPICENFIDEFDKRTKGLNTLSTFDSLDVPFTTNEIRQPIKTLGKNKSCSTDNVIYEYFTEGIDVLDKPLVILFNYILEKQSFPKSWSKWVIIPIHKKGETSNPNNYRGITLINCFAKLFTSVINNR